MTTVVSDGEEAMFGIVLNGKDPGGLLAQIRRFRTFGFMADPLVAKLSKLLRSQPASVEVLPPDWTSSPSNPHQPFEFTENHLGIPKGTYYKVYLKAIQNFNQLLSEQINDAPQTVDVEEVLDTTLIILLVNPSHSTCLNKRKEIVQNGKWSEQQELQMTAALQLPSEGAKSSILWHHRRWLLRRMYSPSNASGENEDDLEACRLPLDVVSSEISVATTASEVYPRNYHAWLHRYKCLRSMASTYRAIDKASPSQSDDVWAQMLRAEEFALKKWIEHNVTDYTAMQYLCHVYSTMEELAVKHIQLNIEEEGEESDANESNLEKSKVAFSPVEHAVDLIQRYPSHEALWHYLRAGYATLKLCDQDLVASRNLGDPNELYAKHFERWRKVWDSSSRVPTLT